MNCLLMCRKPIVCLLVFSLFSIAIPAFAQDTSLQPIYTGFFPENVRWSEDSRWLVFQGSTSVSIYENGVQITDQSWVRFDRETGTPTNGNLWPLQPVLSASEQQAFDPVANTFIYQAPNDRYILYNRVSNPLALEDRQSQQVFNTPVEAAFTSTGPDRFNVMWSGDSTAFVLITHSLNFLPLIYYGSNFDGDISALQLQDLFAPQVGSEQFVALQPYDVSNDGTLVMLAARTPSPERQRRLIVWNALDSAAGFIVEEDTIGGSFKPGDESKCLFVNETGLIEYDSVTQTATVLRTDINSTWLERAVFSPDGAYVALIDRDGFPRIYVVAIDQASDE